MKDSLLRLLALSAAVSIPTEAAYELLQQSYIDSFRKKWEGACNSKQVSVVDAFIAYTIEELPVKVDGCQSVGFQLNNDRDIIIERFVKSSVSELVTQLANREVVLEAVREFMKKENNNWAVYGKLKSTRMQVVFAMFMASFAENSGYAFRFEGSFMGFVMHSFIDFFYKPRKKDIWDALNESDTARKDVEYNLVQEKHLEVLRKDDLPIHDLVVYISEADDLLFRHAGQQEEVRGVVYDIYYLLLCYLCEQKIAAKNKELKGITLKFIDPLDFKDARIDKDANKGVSAKIINAKDLVPRVFEYVRAGKLSAIQLSDLRHICFSLGKCDREGRNCVWKDVTINGETSRYLDDASSAANYEAFNKVLKGVVSAYTLLKESEARGVDLISTYNPDLFIDPDVVRYIDYLSSVPCIDLMRKLQAEDKDNRNHGELLRFPKMVDKYSGSIENNSPGIKENRFYARTRGLLVNPKLKQQVEYRTAYERLQSVANCFTATPRSYLEYYEEQVKGVRAKKPQRQLPWLSLPAADIVAGHYTNLCHNIFFTQKPDVARYYLLSVAESCEPVSCGRNLEDPINDITPTAGVGKSLHDSLTAKVIADKGDTGVLQDMSWHLGTAGIESMYYGNQFLLFVPAVRQFLVYAKDDSSRNNLLGVYTLDAVLRRCNDLTCRTGVDVPCGTRYAPVPLVGHLSPEVWERKFQSSMDFSSYLGITNFVSASSVKRYEDMNVHPEYKKLVQKYYCWKQELSRMQQSMIQMLQAIFSYAIYLADVRTPAEPRDHAKGAVMLDCLCKKEFDSETLNWFLDALNAKARLDTINVQVEPQEDFVALDRQALRVAFNTLTEDPEEGSLLGEFMDSVAEETDPATRFILFYNMLATRIYFLRLLGDAYALMFTVAINDISTLNCELNYRLSVKEKLSKFHEEDEGSIGASIDTKEAGAMRYESWIVRDNCMKEFIVLIEQLGTYLGKCEQEISDLVDYNIASSKEVVSRFSSFGSTFDILPMIQETEPLRRLRAKATLDTAGFFLYNGTYFKGRNGRLTYYVHRTGRMLVDNGKELKAASFKFSDPSQLKIYNAILSGGLGNDSTKID